MQASECRPLDIWTQIMGLAMDLTPIDVVSGRVEAGRFRAHRTRMLTVCRSWHDIARPLLFHDLRFLEKGSSLFTIHELLSLFADFQGMIAKHTRVVYCDIESQWDTKPEKTAVYISHILSHARNLRCLIGYLPVDASQFSVLIRMSFVVLTHLQIKLHKSQANDVYVVLLNRLVNLRWLEIDVPDYPHDMPEKLNFKKEIWGKDFPSGANQRLSLPLLKCFRLLNCSHSDKNEARFTFPLQLAAHANLPLLSHLDMRIWHSNLNIPAGEIQVQAFSKTLTHLYLESSRYDILRGLEEMAPHVIELGFYDRRLNVTAQDIPDPTLCHSRLRRLMLGANRVLDHIVQRISTRWLPNLKSVELLEYYNAESNESLECKSAMLWVTWLSRQGFSLLDSDGRPVQPMSHERVPPEIWTNIFEIATAYMQIPGQSDCVSYVELNRPRVQEELQIRVNLLQVCRQWMMMAAQFCFIDLHLQRQSTLSKLASLLTKSPKTRQYIQQHTRIICLSLLHGFHSLSDPVNLCVVLSCATRLKFLIGYVRTGVSWPLVTRSAASATLTHLALSLHLVERAGPTVAQLNRLTGLQWLQIDARIETNDTSFSSVPRLTLPYLTSLTIMANGRYDYFRRADRHFPLHITANAILPSLTHLRIEIGGYKMSDQNGQAQVMPFSSTLTHLNLTLSRFDILRVIGKVAPHVEDLTFYSNEMFMNTEDGSPIVVIDHPTIRRLTLGPTVDMWSLVQGISLETMPALESVHLSGVQWSHPDSWSKSYSECISWANRLALLDIPLLDADGKQPEHLSSGNVLQM